MALLHVLPWYDFRFSLSKKLPLGVLPCRGGGSSYPRRPNTTHTGKQAIISTSYCHKQCLPNSRETGTANSVNTKHISPTTADAPFAATGPDGHKGVGYVLLPTRLDAVSCLRRTPVCDPGV